MKSLVVLFVKVSFDSSFEGVRGLNVTDVRRERIPFLWSTVGETALAKGFLFYHGGYEVSVYLQNNEAA